MPRLSIVVPFVSDEAAIHTTLLSLLENRPEDCEILVSHNGTYEDPYSLLDDEAIGIETSPNVSSVGLINEGLLAACAPYVQVLLPGCRVESDWATEPLEMLEQDPLISGVILPLRISANELSYGFDMTALPRRIALSKGRFRGSATPAINGAILRRKILRMLDGFLDVGSIANSEIELGLAMRTLGLEAVQCEVTEIDATQLPSIHDNGAYARGQSYGRVALAYSKIDASGVEINSLLSRLSHLAGGLMNPGSVAERLGWVLGLTDTSLVKTIRRRVESAQATMDEQACAENEAMRVPVQSTFRRAA